MANNFTLPTVNDTTDLFTMFKFINNTSSGGLFFPLVVLGIWAIAFILSLNQGEEGVRAWIFASLVAVFLTIPLAILGLFSSQYMYLIILLVAFGVFWIRLQNPPSS